VKKQAHTIDVWIGVEMIDPRGVKGTGPADDPMNFVTFFYEQVGEVTPILSSDTSNERFLHLRPFAVARTARAAQANTFAHPLPEKIWRGASSFVSMPR
jgi:hypothetical protein